MNASPRQRPKSGGFTLVELLLAVTLMSLLLALAYGGLRAATRATERGQDMLEASGNVRTVHQFIRRQLNQALPLAFEVEEGVEESRIVFRGDSRRIEYVAPMPGYLGRGGPQVQVLEFVPGEDGDDLMFSHALLQDFLPERLLDREPILLLSGVEQGSFEFLTRDEEGAVAGWVGQWDDPSNIPVAIRLDVAFQQERPITWPLLITGVRVDATSVNLARPPARSYQEQIQRLIDNPDGDER